MRCSWIIWYEWMLSNDEEIVSQSIHCYSSSFIWQYRCVFFVFFVCFVVNHESKKFRDLYQFGYSIAYKNYFIHLLHILKFYGIFLLSYVSWIECFYFYFSWIYFVVFSQEYDIGLILVWMLTRYWLFWFFGIRMLQWIQKLSVWKEKKRKYMKSNMYHW